MIKIVKLTQPQIVKGKAMNLFQSVKVVKITRRGLPYGAYIKGTDATITAIMELLK